MISWLFAFLALAAAVPPAGGSASSASSVRLVPAPGGVVLQWGKNKSGVLRGKGDGATVARVETAQAAGTNWALVRWPLGSGGHKVWAFVQEKPGSMALAWEGTDGPLDVDEEASTRVAVSEAGLTRSYAASWLRRCDDQAPVWRVESFDTSRRLFSQTTTAPGQASAATQISAGTAPPLLAGKAWPAINQRVFRFTAASAAAAQTARALPSAGVLDDGNTQSAWRPFGAGGGFAFATARASMAIAVAGFAVTKAQDAAWPAKFRITMSASESFDVVVPPDAGATIWLSLPQPISSSCVTIDAHAGAEPQPWAVAEVQVVTALDGAGAVDHIVDSILSGTNCGRALQTLTNADAQAVAKRLVDKLASAAQAGQACAWEALANLPDNTVPAIQTWLPESLPTVLGAPAGVLKRQTLAKWVKRGGQPASQALLGVLGDPSQTARSQEVAVTLLANNVDGVESLLDATFEGETVSLVRRMLLQKGAATQAVVERRLAQPLAVWQRQARLTAELLWLATRLVPRAADPAWQATATACAQDVKTPFALRARCLQALGPSLAGQATLQQVGLHDAEPILRHLAFEALLTSERPQWRPQLEDALVQGLKDRDPRVRQTVVRGFRKAPPEAARRLGAVLRKAYAAERWPFALSAYLESIAAGCVAPEPLQAATTRDDLPLDGKVAALEGLAACKFPAARSEALQTVKRQVAPVTLREAAARVLIDVGHAEDAPTLLRVLRQATSASASDPSLEDVAAAVLGTLVALDPSQATMASLEMINQTRPRLRRSGMVALGKLCGPRAVVAIEAHLGSPDAWLANAAQQAKAQCQSSLKTP